MGGEQSQVGPFWVGGAALLIRSGRDCVAGGEGCGV